MDKLIKQTFELASPEATQELASQIGAKLRGGEVIELISDLGGGKTTFVKGLVQGLGSPDPVTSPSFTLRNDYLAGKLSVAHFDFYRLNDPGILNQMLAEAENDPKLIVVIEWAQIVANVLPEARIKMTFKVSGETKRQLEISYPNSLSYLFEGLDA